MSNLCLSTNRFTQENLNLRYIIQECFFYTLCQDSCKLFAIKVQIHKLTLILTQQYKLIILKLWDFVRTIFSVLAKTRPNINKLCHDDYSYMGKQLVYKQWTNFKSHSHFECTGHSAQPSVMWLLFTSKSVFVRNF